jgi:hypothetical protein
MPDLLIRGLDEAATARLKAAAAAAERRGLDLGSLIVEALDSRAEEGEDDGLVEEIAAMRASQPRQEGDAAQDTRRLRDGGDEPWDETRAA